MTIHLSHELDQRSAIKRLEDYDFTLGLPRVSDRRNLASENEIHELYRADLLNKGKRSFETCRSAGLVCK